MKISAIHLETGALTEYNINKQGTEIIDIDSKHLQVQYRDNSVRIKDKKTGKAIRIPEFCMYDMVELFTILNSVHGNWCSPSLLMYGEPLLINNERINKGATDK